MLNVADTQGIFYDPEDEEFYLIANKSEDKIGFYLFKYKYNDPTNFKPIIMWKNKLTIGNVSLRILRGRD